MGISSEIESMIFVMLELGSFMSHLVVPWKKLPTSSGWSALAPAITAAIWVPPPTMTGTDFAAPQSIPMLAGIMGSPTHSIALRGSSAREPGSIPAAARASLTSLVLSSLGLLGELLLTRFSLRTPMAIMTASAVVVPPAQLSLMITKSYALASISPSM